MTGVFCDKLALLSCFGKWTQFLTLTSMQSVGTYIYKYLINMQKYKKIINIISFDRIYDHIKC
jgi:uncharacterized membrane protein YjjP (DUF1212 family)